MRLYSVGVRGGLKRISKAEFKEDNVYLIDDFKTIYVWFGSNISKKRKDITINKANLLNEKKEKNYRYNYYLLFIYSLSCQKMY